MRAGLVLSGGIAKGAYQLGVLKVFSKRLPEDFFQCISASSVGILNAYAYATGQLEQAEKAWRTLEFSGMLGFVRSFARGSYTQKLLREYSFEKPLLQQLYATCLSIPQMKLKYVEMSRLTSEQQYKYLCAGVAVPPFCTPIEVDGMKYIDGAMVDNIPVQPVFNRDLDRVVVVYFDDENYIFESEEFDARVVRINFQEKHIIRDSFAFDADSVGQMIEEGEKRANRIVDEYLADSQSQAVEIMKKRAGEQKKHKRKIRITGDVIVNNINLYAKKLIAYQLVDAADAPSEYATEP